MDRCSERVDKVADLVAGTAEEDDLRSRGFLSQTHQRFANYAAQQPEDLLRSSYSALQSLNHATLYRTQPWPVFLPRARGKEFEALAVGLTRILLDLPRRVFANDPQRFQEFYNIPPDQAQLIATLIDNTDVLGGATTRGDYLETEDGLKCLEFNVSGGLGGWSVGPWTRGYLADPLVRDFLKHSALEVTFQVPAQGVLRHLLREADSLANEGEVNVAFVVPTEDLLASAGRWAEDYENEYREALASRPDRTGSAVTCCISDLQEEGGVLCYQGRRIHAVVEACGDTITRPVLSALMAGTVRVYNGPVNRVLADKLNLALLSELADSSFLSAAETATVRAHVPWTRRVSPDFVDYQNERVYLPDLLADEQEKMVIKAGFSARGEEVFIGRGMSRQEWEELVERTANTPGWVAQEFLEGVTYNFQAGNFQAGNLEAGNLEAGNLEADDDPRRPPCAHDLVWGLLTFGEHYTGCFVRLMARGGHGVINSARGACGGAVLEVEESPVTDGPRRS